MGLFTRLRGGTATTTAAAPATQTKQPKAKRGVDYEGAWNEYARDWRSRFPGLNHIGDEWTGQEAGAAGNTEDYSQLIEDRFIAPYIEDGDTVMELGVGGGKTAVMLRARCKQLVCVDIAEEMLAATRDRLGDNGVRYVKIDGVKLDGVAARSNDVAFCFDTMVHIEPRDIYNYLSRIPRLMRGRRLCVFHHTNMLSDRGWQRFLREWDKNLMGKRHGRSFSVMTDSIMERFLEHLGYEIIVRDTTSIPRDCVWVVRAPEV